MLTSLLPLLALMLGAIVYSQKVYLGSVDRELQATLDRVALTLDQHFSHQRLLLESLAQSPLLLDFARAVRDLDRTEAARTRFDQEKGRIEALLNDLHALVAEDAVIRVLDASANTLIKVHFGASPLPRLQSLLPYEIRETEPDPAFVRRLRTLPPRQISHLRFPAAATDYAPVPLRLLDMVRPVTLGDDTVLYLVLTSVGERLDRLLAIAPRPFKATLSIVERDLDRGTDELAVLYDDARRAGFATAGPGEHSPPPWLAARLPAQRAGVGFDDADHGKRYFVSEYIPYPERLLNWILIAEVDRDIFTAQYRLLRLGLLALGVVAIGLSLFLAHLASRLISAPIVRLSENLEAYGRGESPAADLPTATTEIRNLQRSFRAMTESLTAAEQEKAAAQQRLLRTAKLASIGEMAAGIGHELNNPLNNILALIKLLGRRLATDDAAQQDLQSLREEAHRAALIVRGVLNFAKQIQPTLQRYAVAPWLETCVRRVQRSADAKRIVIRIECEADLLAHADPFQMEQVVVNLLTNAIQASPEDGEILLAAARTDPWLRLQIIDQGGGLPPEVLDHLFEPFFTTKPFGEGSGLGLSVSLGIVESHGGQLHLFNHAQGGCTAEILLPLESPETQA